MKKFSQVIEKTSFFVREEEARSRIDLLLKKRFPHFSRTYFQFLIDNDYVLLNGIFVKKRICPKKGDEITLFFAATEENPSLEPENIPLDILYEDEHLLAINKPAGMVVHPAPGNWSSTFVNALLYHCKNLESHGDPFRPGIIHRLDKDTSGILLAAKTYLAHQRLFSLFAERKVLKYYLAICLGQLKASSLSAPIKRHHIKRKEMAISPEGKEAISQFRLLAFNGSLSLVLVLPKTGRTHQIRVHLKHLGSPILGDPVYGNIKANRSCNIHRQLLHAFRLQLPHPVEESLSLDLIAPLPKDMKVLFKHFSA